MTLPSTQSLARQLAYVLESPFPRNLLLISIPALLAVLFIPHVHTFTKTYPLALTAIVTLTAVILTILTTLRGDGR